MSMLEPLIVISLGGSLVVTKDGIRADFLREFRSLILEEIGNGKKFILIIGGGATARMYMHAAEAVVPLQPEDKDWLGIHATRINAHLLRTIFRNVAHPVVIKNPSRKMIWNEPLLIAAGWKPGWSTDYVGVRLAKAYGASTLVNLTNIDRVYEQDPKAFPDAKSLGHVSWKIYRSIVGKAWSPGLNAPFDPVASRFANRLHMRVVIANGNDLENVKKILHGEEFLGTTIE